MKNFKCQTGHVFLYLYLFSALLFLSSCSDKNEKIKGLLEDVEVIRDVNGINHIYAKNEQDLFFTQGYLAAKDRLFQFEVWRRRATGTAAEILGPREIERDKGARLFKFRGDKKEELSHYHPNGEAIVDAFVLGVNAYIKEVRDNPDLLPFEFKVLDILPEFWTWEVVISRHQGLLENVEDELKYARVVAELGAERAKELYYFHPNEPDLSIPEGIPTALLKKDILAPYKSFRKALTFEPEDVQVAHRIEKANSEAFLAFVHEEEQRHEMYEKFDMGSNNWVLSGEKTQSGYPLMANDPHRLHAVPSLRYWVHLHAPGWNVIGAGEPVIPGVSIGHNGQGAWGLTIFETDNEDMRVYELHPENPHKYKYKGEWLEMEKIFDTISVKGQDDVITTHYYTVHGPVTFIDEELNKAVAVECAWLNPGGAPYLASLRMNQSQTWEEFREACAYNHIPAENMVWADKDGNIGWQATGITPLRKTHSGLLPALGDGSMDWEGFLPIKERPHLHNPENGRIATANENVTPPEYPHQHAIGFDWADAFRGDRVREVLDKAGKFTMEGMGALQNDYQALPARALVPHLLNLSFEDSAALEAKDRLSEWDHNLDPNSISAGIYVMWERKLRDRLRNELVPKHLHNDFGVVKMTRVLQWVERPEKIFPSDSKKMMQEILKESFLEALEELKSRFGEKQENWQYGQENYKHAWHRHPLSDLLAEDWQKKLDMGPVPRGGYSFTPAANAYGDNNSSGASFRIIVDTGDWDKTLGINTPGQSGDPDSPFYGNLFPVWSKDNFFRVPYSKEKVKENAFEKTMLKPKS
ncbi:penicillin acylase family protein [Arthrospiribacter ruber]|uniref:Penicillin acylase family protein n=1 Tax=Arthrospiribacter ruber TaxID=2487934 RepID=A0A951IWM6_9BACT|nr:penicillin acylase family protein [Arthrospiribacter ruber]MBW3468600.1 penicillin acylase family protein [Arthrospiribacter ruber]